jgi:hypothetical protein
MAKGRRADDVVLNLTSEAQYLLTNAEWKQVIDRFFSQLRQYEHKHRSIRLISNCDKCGCQLMFSGTEKCEQCNNPVNWPDALRTLMCMNNLLWLFEQRVEIKSSEAFSEFVCVLVSMMDNLLRKQEFPIDQHRRYAIDLLISMQVIIDLNKGAYVETTNPNDLRLHFIKNQMREDSESYGVFLMIELQFFVKKMTHGDRI